MHTKPYANKTEWVNSAADSLGVHVNSVWNWLRSGTLPKNPLTRAAYLKLTAKPKRKQVAK